MGSTRRHPVAYFFFWLTGIACFLLFLGMLHANILGGLILGAPLFFAWIGFWRIYAIGFAEPRFDETTLPPTRGRTSQSGYSTPPDRSEAQEGQDFADFHRTWWR